MLVMTVCSHSVVDCTTSPRFGWKKTIPEYRFSVCPRMGYPRLSPNLWFILRFPETGKFMVVTPTYFPAHPSLKLLVQTLQLANKSLAYSNTHAEFGENLRNPFDYGWEWSNMWPPVQGHPTSSNYMRVSTNGGTPIARWFIREKPTGWFRGTPMTMETPMYGLSWKHCRWPTWGSQVPGSGCRPCHLWQEMRSAAARGCHVFVADHPGNTQWPNKQRRGPHLFAFFWGWVTLSPIRWCCDPSIYSRLSRTVIRRRQRYIL